MFDDLPSLSSHISNVHSMTLTPEDESTSDKALINCQSQIELSLATVEPATVEPTAKNAVNLLYPPENNQSNSQIIGNVISALKLSPFDVGIDYKDGFKEKITALTTVDVENMEHRKVKKKILSTPYDKLFSWTKLHSCLTPPCNQIIKNSAYSQLLAFDNNVMSNEEHLELLNAHWRKRPWMYLLVASSILVDDSHALLLNGVESYCRYPSIDAHFEKKFRVNHHFLISSPSTHACEKKMLSLYFLKQRHKSKQKFGIF